ncbi:trafficking kinesin-binding protein milt isoform X2 [Culicoides brevitarsis]|uniref:trafficking kinesin-binding protein milt isoform X2 n=1 Tax=Culicoides brevitarsis TaxID=469753 RepID=UPI00307B7CC6
MLHTTAIHSTTSPLSPNTKATLEKHGIAKTAGLLAGVAAAASATQTRQKRDVGCVTDLCSNEQLDEVEIFSLLEEQLPRYKLRADSLTKFGGYQNNDWFVQFPAYPIPEGGLKISKELAQETLNYFLLSGDRVSQMTRTFDDPEAISRLLEEKEKDLELTVQIGKELLAQNNTLESRVAELEAELAKTSENLNQLTHDLQQKNELINVLTNDLDDGSENTTPIGARSINVDILQRKVTQLETENKLLRVEAEQIANETTSVEEQERKLMDDIVYQLSTANNESHAIRLELERYKEENRLQQEQIIHLTARLHSTELRLHELLSENEETSSMLHITKENQNALAIELVEFKTKYQEVLTLLHDAQDQLKKQKRRAVPMVRSSLIATSCGARDSLQSELMETSMLSENSLDSGIMSDRPLMHPKGNSEFQKVFETVKYANTHMTSSSHDGFSSSNMSVLSSQGSQPRMSPMLLSSSASQASNQRYYSQRHSSIYGNLSSNTTASGLGDCSSSISGSLFKSDLADISGGVSSDEGYSAPAGVPGCPGAKDLEAAIKRLTPAEILARRAVLSHGATGSLYLDDSTTAQEPTGMRTPDSVLSGGSCQTGVSSLSSNTWKLPEKLQIIKPIEGSQTLFHWQKLATPTLGGILEERAGVAVKGGRTLDELGLQMYSLEDVEEDEELMPTKRFQQSAYTNTFTNSMVMHPDDGTASVTFSLPPSQMSSQINSACSSRQPSAPATPRASLSRRNSCSTFSVHMGLASVLNERGIKAVTPSVLNTPTGPNYSPTVTPCNSPDGSPTREMSDAPLISGLLASGAELLRRKLIGVPVERPSRLAARNKLALSRLEKKALKSIKILEKVESIGVDNIMAPPTTVSPLALHSTSMYQGRVRRSDSPMTQLTKHLGSDASSSSTGAISKKPPRPEVTRIPKETIRAVLNKGLAAADDDMDTDTESSVTSSVLSSDEPKAVAVSRHRSRSRSSHNNASNSGAATKKGPTETSASVADSCVRRMQRQKSRRQLIHGGQGARRADLGTVNSTHRSSMQDLGNVENQKPETHEGGIFAQGVVGTLSSLIFGRKGGFT